MRGTFEEPPTGLIPWFSKPKGNTYATIVASPFPLQGKPTQSQDVARRISGTVVTHLNNFVDLCDMQKKKDMDNDIVKLKLFPFSIRDRAKVWFSSLPKNSIDSWNKCKDAFISKYFLPLRSSLLGTIL